MTTIPITIVDDFFENPDSVRDWALSLKYESESSGRWPGKRSDYLHLIHPFFYRSVCTKVLSLFFENTTDLNFQINLKFQLIENYQGSGWVHQDMDLFTFLIYLHESDPKVDCGTSIWSLNPKLISPINNPFDEFNSGERSNHYKNINFNKEAHNSYHKNFVKEISIPDKYNRFIAFSSNHFHSANNFNTKLSPRLTLVGFVQNLSTSKLPIIRSKQSPMN